MKRTGPLRRKTPMPRPATRIKPRGRPRHAESGAPNEDFRAWIREQRCIVSGRRGCHACHVKSRGAGGTDMGNLVPMMPEHHAAQHYMGIASFQALHGLDLAAIAEQLFRTYQGEHAP